MSPLPLSVSCSFPSYAMLSLNPVNFATRSVLAWTRTSHPAQRPEHFADDMGVLGEAGIGRVVRVGGDQA